MIVEPLAVGGFVIAHFALNLQPALGEGDVLEVDEAQLDAKGRPCIAAHDEVAAGELFVDQCRRWFLGADGGEYATVLALSVGLLHPKASRVLVLWKEMSHLGFVAVVGNIRGIACPQLGTECIRETLGGVEFVPKSAMCHARVALRDGAATV